MEKLTPPAISEKYIHEYSLPESKKLPTKIESNLVGTKKILHEGDFFALPASVTDTFPLDEMKKAPAVIGKTIHRGGDTFVEVEIQIPGSPITREYPADDPMFGLGDVSPIELNPKISYTKNKEILLSRHEALTAQEEAITLEIERLKKSLAPEQKTQTQSKPKTAPTPIIEQKPIAPEKTESKKKNLTPLEKQQYDRKLYREAYEHLKKGINRVVIHGGTAKYHEDELAKAIHKNENPFKEGQIVNTISPDLDVDGSLFLLHTKGKNGKPIINYKEGAFTQSTNKGKGNIEGAQPGDIVFHIDRGGKDFDIEIIDGVVHIYADHHNPEKDWPTSATKIVDKIMSENPEYRALKKENPWMEEFIEYTVALDNLTYLDKRNPKEPTKPFFTKETFLNTWPSSLYAHGDLPLENILSYFKEGKNPWYPFTNGEMQESIKAKKEKAEKTIFETERAIKTQKEIGIPESTSELGKVVYHNHRKGIKIDNGLAFITAKALGNDTFVKFNPKDGSFFINSSTKDLTPIFERLEKLYPGVTLVRGVMVFAPKDAALLKSVSEEQFLKAVGLK